MIATVAALIGDPARANMLAALMSGKALTATELANEAGITAQTASSHLSKLENGGLISGVKQGRHRYFRLSGHDVRRDFETASPHGDALELACDGAERAAFRKSCRATTGEKSHERRLPDPL